LQRNPLGLGGLAVAGWKLWRAGERRSRGGARRPRRWPALRSAPVEQRRPKRRRAGLEFGPELPAICRDSFSPPFFFPEDDSLDALVVSTSLFIGSVQFVSSLGRNSRVCGYWDEILPSIPSKKKLPSSLGFGEPFPRFLSSCRLVL
jgi:hypothetical protein